MVVFAMPSLGADMEAGTLVEWLVKPGDRVRRGDVVAVVETQKGAIEIEVFEDGVVEKLVAELGQSLPVGAPLALIAADGEKPHVKEEAGPAIAPEVKAVVRAPAPPPPPRPVVQPPAPGIAASPAARARAAELGLDLAALVGTGPGGAVVLSDVETRPTAAPTQPDRALDIAEMRRAIAAAMARSKREIPHYTMTHTVDLGAASAWMEAANAERPPEQRMLMGALLARATALTARAEPRFNGFFDGAAYEPAGRVHLGIAVALRGGGLLAPAILDADTLPLRRLMAAMRDITARTRAGRLRSSEMSMATLTLSSLGETGVEAMAGIIVPPQVALVTAGSPRSAPMAREGAVAVRPVVTLTLSADHRVSDGRLGARFLLEIDRLLQSPEAL